MKKELHMTTSYLFDILLIYCRLSVINWQLPAFVSRTALNLDDYTVCLYLLAVLV